MLQLKIGGVPEHFNYPWYLTLKNKEYTPFDINLRWQDFPGGTGQMAAALRDGSIDIAIILTEGIIKDIVEGNPSKIVQTYVDSPLLWGIHCNINSLIHTIKDLKNKMAAISKFGSGSHLMAIINAKNLGWSANDINFLEVQNLEGGIESLTNNTSDYFLWEHFTTKPYVDNGIVKRVGNCPTPWPCFVIAVRNEILEKHPEAIKNVLTVINQKTAHFKEIENIDQILAKRYNQKVEDIQIWLDKTAWNTGNPISDQLINSIQEKLVSYSVIKKTVSINQLIEKV